MKEILLIFILLNLILTGCNVELDNTNNTITDCFGLDGEYYYDKDLKECVRVNPINESLDLYNTKQECEEVNNCVCDFVTCDYIPKGKTFEEVCGKDFKKGWQCVIK